MCHGGGNREPPSPDASWGLGIIALCCGVLVLRALAAAVILIFLIAQVSCFFKKKKVTQVNDNASEEW